MKERSNEKILRIIIPVCIALIFIGLAVILVLRFSEKDDIADTEEYATVFDKKLGLLEKKVVNDKQSIAFKGNHTVFVSVSDSYTRARVFRGIGSNTQSAWDDAEAQIREFVIENAYDPLWIKAETISFAEQISADEYSKRLEQNYEYMYRAGLAFDQSFKDFILEGELLTNDILDFESNTVDLSKLNTFFEKVGRDTKISEFPETVTVFTCDGYFANENADIYALHSDQQNYGRRVTGCPDADQALEIMSSAASYLYSQLEETGKFIYGYYPSSGKNIGSYNSLRHAGTIWSLICQYKTKPDSSMPDKIRSAIDFLLSPYTGKTGGFYLEKDENTAFIVERKDETIKVGGNGIAIMALSEYLYEFGEDDPNYDRYYNALVKLANGILEMQHEDGSYSHLWSLDYKVISEFVTVFYDGEATFALARTYSLTMDKKYLDGAEKAVQMFIREDYTKYRDHWVSYALNEVTMYAPKEEYFRFALDNAAKNLKKIYFQKTPYNVFMELLMSTFDLYDRMIQSGVSSEALKSFDSDLFLDTIFKRAEFMLNSYAYPELIMHLEEPSRTCGSFFIRHDNFRIRIDDVQHFVGGYYRYYLNYDKLLHYRFPEKYDYPKD